MELIWVDWICSLVSSKEGFDDGHCPMYGRKAKHRSPLTILTNTRSSKMKYLLQAPSSPHPKHHRPECWPACNSSVSPWPSPSHATDPAPTTLRPRDVLPVWILPSSSKMPWRTARYSGCWSKTWRAWGWSGPFFRLRWSRVSCSTRWSVGIPCTRRLRRRRRQRTLPREGCRQKSLQVGGRRILRI